jgi:hypothetical protein
VELRMSWQFMEPAPGGGFFQHDSLGMTILGARKLRDDLTRAIILAELATETPKWSDDGNQ